MRAGCAALCLALIAVPVAGCRIDDAADSAQPANVSRPPPRQGGSGGSGVPSPAPPDLKAPGAPALPPVDGGSSPPVDAPVDAPSDANPPLAADAMPSLPPAPPVVPGVWWRPAVGLSWDWQLKTPIDPSHDVQVYDIDLFENEASVIADLKARGRKVICYVNLGAWENWRPDAGRFPRELIGAAYHGFPDENWLDIRRLDLLGPIVRSRLELARTKGCDAVEPDNMDGYDVSAHEPSGFPLTFIDQLVYNRFVAAEAHARGLAVGLKNDVHQVEYLVGDFDFHVSEQCYQHDECHLLLPFIAAGKPIFLAEYELPLEAFCPMARAAGISVIRKKNDLDAWREVCP